MPTKRNAALDAILATPAKVPEPTTSVVSFHPAPSSPDDAKAIAKVMLYLPPKVAKKFKEIAFHEDCKAHDVYLRALAAYLRSEGHGPTADLLVR